MFLITHKLTSEELANILITPIVLYSASQTGNLAVAIPRDMESGTYQMEHWYLCGGICQNLKLNFIEAGGIMDKCFSIVSLMIILLQDDSVVRCLISLVLIKPSVYLLVGLLLI